LKTKKTHKQQLSRQKNPKDKNEKIVDLLLFFYIFASSNAPRGLTWSLTEK